MESAAEAELSIPPEATADARASTAGDGTATLGDQQAAPTAGSAARTTSSAEYIVGGIKRHRRAAAVTLAALAALAAGGYAVYRLAARRDAPALSFQGAKLTRLT